MRSDSDKKTLLVTGVMVSRIDAHAPFLSLTVLLCLRRVEPHVLAGVCWLYYAGLWRADPGHPLLWMAICIFIAIVTSSVNTPLTPGATPGPDGITSLSHPKWERLQGSGSSSTGAQVPVDLAFWDGNWVSSHVNVDFPLGKMIDLCCAVAVNRQ